MILSNLLLEIEIENPAWDAQEGLIALGIMAFSIVLFALSITAYRNTGMKKILYAATAFGLFGIIQFIEFFEEFVEFTYEIPIDITLSILTLAILVLFFLAIVKRR